MDSFVHPDAITAEFLIYIYLFPGSIALTDKITWDGYRVIDSSLADRQRLLNHFPGLVF